MANENEIEKIEVNTEEIEKNEILDEKVRLSSVEDGTGLASKAKRFINKKVSVKFLVLAILLSLGVGRLSNYIGSSNKKYNISDIYVGAYNDYYGVERLAVLTKEEINQYKEINNTFTSDDIKLNNIRLLYTCLNDSDLQKIRKKGNMLSINEINKLLDSVIESSKSEKLEGNSLENSQLQENKEVEVISETGLYDPKNLYLGIFVDVTGEYKCDIFNRVSMKGQLMFANYSQYKKLYYASTFYNERKKYVYLEVVDPLAILLNEEEKNEVTINNGLTEEQIEAIKNRANELIKAGKYNSLNNTDESKTDEVSEITNAVDGDLTDQNSLEVEENTEEEPKEVVDPLAILEDDVSLTYDMECVIYSSKDETSTKFLLYDSYLEKYFDETGELTLDLDDGESFYIDGKVLMDKTPLLSLATPEIEEIIGEDLYKKAFLTMNDIKTICRTLTNVDYKELLEIKEKAEKKDNISLGSK